MIDFEARVRIGCLANSLAIQSECALQSQAFLFYVKVTYVLTASIVNFEKVFCIGGGDWYTHYIATNFIIA